MQIFIKNCNVTIHSCSSQRQECLQTRSLQSGSRLRSSMDCHASKILSDAEKIRQTIVEEMRRAMNQAGVGFPRGR